MKSNSFTSILLGVLAVSAVASLALCGMHIHYTRQLRSLQGQVGFINFRQAAVRQLIEETADYARKTNNREVAQILETIGVKLAPVGAAGTSTPK